MSILKRAQLASFVCICVAILPTSIAAEEVPIVDGTLWEQSSNVEKKSYLVGVSNFIVLEHAYQSKAEKPPTPFQSSVPDFFQHTDNVTLDGAIRAVDEWYEKNPRDMDTPVLTVLWRKFVEPKL